MIFLEQLFQYTQTKMIRNTPRSTTTNTSLYKDIPKESQISQKTLDIVKSITLAKPLSDKTQQQSANQRITQQTNYTAFENMCGKNLNWKVISIYRNL